MPLHRDGSILVTMKRIQQSFHSISDCNDQRCLGTSYAPRPALNEFVRRWCHLIIHDDEIHGIVGRQAPVPSVDREEPDSEPSITRHQPDASGGPGAAFRRTGRSALVLIKTRPSTVSANSSPRTARLTHRRRRSMIACPHVNLSYIGAGDDSSSRRWQSEDQDFLKF